MRGKKIIVISLCALAVGCTSVPDNNMQTGDAKRQVIDVYDKRGNNREHIIINGDHIIIYDKDWKTKGYGKLKSDEN